MSKIDEIKARWAAATPGPWVDMPPQGDSGFLVYGPDPKGTPIAAATHVKDLLAIAAAPEDIRWLVERVERLESALIKIDDVGGNIGEFHTYTGKRTPSDRLSLVRAIAQAAIESGAAQ